MATRVRLDRELVRRGLAPSREVAGAAIRAGRVLVGGAVAAKPSTLVSAADPVALAGPARRWASRGGDKLAPVLERLQVPVAGRRCLDAEQVGGPVELTVADLSFISLRLVLPVLAGLTRDDGDLVLLVKPQFEVGREAVGRGGVVRDPAARAAAVRGVAEAGAALGLGVAGICPSPLPGPAGNLELFLRLRADAAPLDEAELQAALAEGAALPGAAT